MSEVSFDVFSHVRPFDAFSLGGPAAGLFFPYEKFPATAPFGDNGDLWHTNAGSPVLVRTVANAYEAHHAETTLDGSKIVYVLTDNNHVVADTIRIIAPDGSGDLAVATLTGSGFGDAAIPRFSADGSKILYVDATFSGSTTTTRLKIVNSDGTGGATLYTTTSTGIPSFSFNAAGTKIAFSADGKIKTMNVDGTGVFDVVTIGPTFCRFGFTDDTIYYLSAGGYKVNADGTGNTLLGAQLGSSNLATRHFLAWDDSALFIASDPPGGSAVAELNRIPTDGSGTVTTGVAMGYPHAFDGRVYAEGYTAYPSGFAFISCAYDGSDVRVEDTDSPGFIELGDF